MGENKEFERQYLQGELEVELTPQVGKRISNWDSSRSIPGHLGGEDPSRRSRNPCLLHLHSLWHFGARGEERLLDIFIFCLNLATSHI